MSKDLLKFVTPGPLTETFGFSARVFGSWIILGLLLGLIFGIASISSGTATASIPLDFLVEVLFTFPIVICLFGLIGLGIDSIRGGSSEYYGWYWWLFPIVTYIVIGFWLSFAIIGFTLGIVGVRLPTPPRNQPRRRKNPNQAVDDWIKKNQQQSSDQFVKKNPKFKPKNRQEEAVYKEIVQNPEKTLEEILSEMSEEEFEAFLAMLMRMLGLTFIS